jgi:hypothetical protein
MSGAATFDMNTGPDFSAAVDKLILKNWIEGHPKVCTDSLIIAIGNCKLTDTSIGGSLCEGSHGWTVGLLGEDVSVQEHHRG